jgi:hypothetical protein
MANMLNIAAPWDIRDIQGWFLISVAGLNIFFNLTLTVASAVQTIYNDRVKKRLKDNAKRAFKKKIENRSKVLE